MGNDILFYIIGAEALVIVGLYFWQRVTARRLKTSEATIAGVKAIGEHQNKQTKKADKRSENIKVDIDAKLEKTLSDIDANYDERMRNSGSGDLSRSPEIRTSSLERAAVRKHPLYIALARRYDKLYAEMSAIKEWYNRETRG